ncbi:MAG: hypothetical protein NZ529_00165 [Cytophagaceae bacterium]|nr:hypothetical protein [Cytophagaceae bacterium]MDW8455178.1 hypothetical protein [Cytophagaceae bacterium]
MKFQKYFPLVPVLAFMIYYCISFQFEVYEGGADNYSHYKFAKYSPSYPILLLDHWAKPVFTILCLPFAQLGFKGVIFFNVLCGVCAAWMAYLVAKELKHSYSWVTFFIVLSMPLYYPVMVSCLTEPLFSLALVVSVYLLLKKKYVAGCIVASFLFLIRTEGFVLYPMFTIYLVVMRQYKAIPFLLCGFLLYSTIGYFAYNDFFWLINKNPYSNTAALYGTGELLHFAKQTKMIFGIPQSILIVGGIFIAIYKFISQFVRKTIEADVFLIEGIWTCFFIAHSIVWWLGTGASLGLIRVMASVLPLAAITAGRTINFLDSFITSYTKIKTYAITFLAVISLLMPFIMYAIPFRYTDIDKTKLAFLDWYKQSVYADKKIHLYDPFFYYYLDLDPFDSTRVNEYIDNKTHPEDEIEPGELYVWDAHFGPNEGGMPIEQIMKNPYFQLVNYFEPSKPIKVLNDHLYCIYVFERVRRNNLSNDSILSHFKSSNIKENLYR